MLKKIVKYGNSCALVLDKALLELLEMSEGSIVKIKTDGISLIITPQNASPEVSISPTITSEGTLKDAIKESLTRSFHDSEKADAYQSGLQAIIDRYTSTIKDKMENPDLHKALNALKKQFGNDLSNPAYAESIAAITQHFIPENAPAIEKMKQEMSLFMKQYSTDDIQHLDMNNMASKFQKIHQKYQHLLPLVTQLQEDPEYIHKMTLLAEKYQSTKSTTNPAEYFEEHTKLISETIPEYALYQEELKKVGELFNKQEEKEKASLTMNKSKKRLTKSLK